MVTFNSAFASARKAGKKEFSWNGKKYNTQVRSGSAPSESARPTSRPARSNATSGRATTNSRPAARPATENSSRPQTRERSAGPAQRPKARPARATTPGAEQARQHAARNTRRSDASRVRSSR